MRSVVVAVREREGRAERVVPGEWIGIRAAGARLERLLAASDRTRLADEVPRGRYLTAIAPIGVGAKADILGREGDGDLPLRGDA